MRIRMRRWILILLGGMLLLGTLGADCTADAMRFWGRRLDNYADEMDGGGKKDFGDVIDDIESWFK